MDVESGKVIKVGDSSLVVGGNEVNNKDLAHGKIDLMRGASDVPN